MEKRIPSSRGDPGPQQKKKGWGGKIAVLLLLLLFLAWTVNALADGPQGSDARAVTDPQGEAERLRNADSNGLDILSGMLATPINALAYGLIYLPSFYSIDELVFGGAGAFTQDEWNKVIKPWWMWSGGISVAAQIIGLIVLLYGLRVLGGAFNPSPQKRAEVQEDLLNILVAAVFVVTGPYILSWLLQVNGAIVEIVKTRLANLGITITGLGKEDLFDAVETQNPLLKAVIRLAFAGLMFHFNMMYMVRRFVLAVLLIVMPLFAWSWAFRRTRMPMMILLSELVTNALMSATHAIVLAFYLTMVNANPAGMMGQWWAKIFALVMVIPMAALLRRMIAGWLNFLGINEEKWAGLAMAGFSGLAGLGMLAGGVVASGAKLGGTILSRLPTGGGSGNDGKDNGGPVPPPIPKISGGDDGPVPPGTARAMTGGGQQGSGFSIPTPLDVSARMAGVKPGEGGFAGTVKPAGSGAGGLGIPTPLDVSAKMGGVKPAGGSFAGTVQPAGSKISGTSGDFGIPTPLDASARMAGVNLDEGGGRSAIQLPGSSAGGDQESGFDIPTPLGVSARMAGLEPDQINHEALKSIQSSVPQESVVPMPNEAKTASAGIAGPLPGGVVEPPREQSRSPQRREHPILDAAEEFAGAAGMFAGAVMGIGIASRHSPFVTPMEKAMRAPFAATRKTLDLLAERNERKRPPLDGPRWR